MKHGWNQLNAQIEHGFIISPLRSGSRIMTVCFSLFFLLLLPCTRHQRRDPFAAGARLLRTRREQLGRSFLRGSGPPAAGAALPHGAVQLLVVINWPVFFFSSPHSYLFIFFTFNVNSASPGIVGLIWKLYSDLIKWLSFVAASGDNRSPDPPRSERLFKVRYESTFRMHYRLIAFCRLRSLFRHTIAAGLIMLFEKGVTVPCTITMSCDKSTYA